jgi:16S rRNA (guanine527-N7)-methyltransferase
MEEILREGLAELGIPAAPEQLALLRQYGERLLEKNAVTNLTAIRDPEGVARLHFLDCAALLKAADLAGPRILDVGAGAGFPGIPLRILQPDSQLTAVDSVGKKVEFINETCQALGIGGVTCRWGRVEEMPDLRESFSAAVSRAVADLEILAELCLPQVETGGVFLAMKGPDCGEEVSRAEFGIKALGGRVRDIFRYRIPGTEGTHAVVVVRKEKPTPPQYPRRYAQIKKRPLRG